MPFAFDETRWELACGKRSDGHSHGWFGIHIHAAALRRLGLHPDQPTATNTGPALPAKWEANGNATLTATSKRALASPATAGRRRNGATTRAGRGRVGGARTARPPTHTGHGSTRQRATTNGQKTALRQSLYGTSQTKRWVWMPK